jgi:hypothetical protein
MQPKLLLAQKVAKPAAEETKTVDESSVGKLILSTLSALRKRLSGG